MKPADLVLMGRAAGAFGLKGEIKVVSYAQDPEVFQRAGALYVGPNPEGARRLTPISQRFHRGRLLLHTREITSREEAALVSGAWVYLERGDLPPLAEGEFYWFELVGALVRTRQGQVLGKVEKVGNVGAHDLLLVKAQDGKEALIPVIEDVVQEIDAAGGLVVVDLPEGLLEAQGWPE